MNITKKQIETLQTFGVVVNDARLVDLADRVLCDGQSQDALLEYATPVFDVLVSSAHMPQSCKGRYVRIAILKRARGASGAPRSIDTRDPNVERIVTVWERVHAGTWGPNCAATVILKASKEAAQEMNNNALAGLLTLAQRMNEIFAQEVAA